MRVRKIRRSQMAYKRCRGPCATHGTSDPNLLSEPRIWPVRRGTFLPRQQPAADTPPRHPDLPPRTCGSRAGGPALLDTFIGNIAASAPRLRCRRRRREPELRGEGCQRDGLRQKRKGWRGADGGPPGAFRASGRVRLGEARRDDGARLAPCVTSRRSRNLREESENSPSAGGGVSVPRVFAAMEFLPEASAPPGGFGWGRRAGTTGPGLRLA